MTEVWRPVVDYEGCYEISNLGNLRSVDRVSHLRGGGKRVGQPIKIYYPPKRYAITTLCKNGVIISHSIHRLVAKAFIPSIEGHTDIDHIDRNKHNNAVTNLRWVTRVMNQSNRGIPKHNTSGEMYIGLINGKYRFTKIIDGKSHQKYFKTLDDAKAYRDIILSHFVNN